MSGSSTPVSCAGYNQNTFYFITKSTDGNDYYLNAVVSGSANQTTSSRTQQPLNNISGFPQATNSSFMGLCSFASKTSSMYLSFEDVSSITQKNKNGSDESSALSNTRVTSIYQLQIAGNATYQLTKTAIELYNSSIFSFIYTSDSNNANNLAYISTSYSNNNHTQLQQQSSSFLNLISLDSPSTHNTSVSITEFGILAVGGDNFQNFYLIQSGSIQEYRLDTKDYNSVNIQTGINSASLKPGTTGQVLSLNTTEYISIYYQETAEIDIFMHDSSRSTYTPLQMRNGYISFSGNNISPTTISTGNNNSNYSSSSSAPISTSSSSKANNISKPSAIRSTVGSDSATTASVPVTSKPSGTAVNHHDTSSSTSSAALVEGKSPFSASTQNIKKDLNDNGNSTVSFDGAYAYQKINITENRLLLPAVVLLSVASSPNQQPPYDIVFLSENNGTNYSVSTMGRIGINPVVDDFGSAGLGGGEIAGIAIGLIASIAIVVTGFLIYTKRCKNRRTTSVGKSLSINPRPLSIQPDKFINPYIMNRSMITDYNNSGHSSSILQESRYIPDEYHDGTRPDIRPLSYSADTVDFAQLSSDELHKLEPDVDGPLFLFSGTYTSPAEEKVTYLQDGYAIRTFETGDDGSKHTIHYFSSANLDTFIRSVYTVLQSTKEVNGVATSSKYIMKSERAIVLNRPTPNFNYQYIWITSPMIPEHSLYHLLFERKKWTFIDHHNSDYKIWSVYAILKSIETVHAHKFVHLAIDLNAFYYDHEMKATDWRLGNFGNARSSSVFTLQRNHLLVPINHSSFTAPEIITQKAGSGGYLTLEAADVWSIGCVIYTVATGGLLLFENDIQVKNLATFSNDMKQHLKIALRDNVESEVFKHILEQILQVDPENRKSIIEVLAYWNSIYNMEE